MEGGEDQGHGNAGDVGRKGVGAWWGGGRRVPMVVGVLRAQGGKFRVVS
jgi:hypothetical protein